MSQGLATRQMWFRYFSLLTFQFTQCSSNCYSLTFVHQCQLGLHRLHQLLSSRPLHQAGLHTKVGHGLRALHLLHLHCISTQRPVRLTQRLLRQRLPRRGPVRQNHRILRPAMLPQLLQEAVQNLPAACSQQHIATQQLQLHGVRRLCQQVHLRLRLRQPGILFPVRRHHVPSAAGQHVPLPRQQEQSHHLRHPLCVVILSHALRHSPPVRCSLPLHLFGNYVHTLGHGRDDASRDRQILSGTFLVSFCLCVVGF